MKVEESLNVTFNESPPPTKLSPLVDDDVGKEEAIKRNVNVDNKNIEDKSIEVDQYINEMLKKFGLEESKPTKTPMSTEIKLTKDDEADSMDRTKYRDGDDGPDSKRSRWWEKEERDTGGSCGLLPVGDFAGVVKSYPRENPGGAIGVVGGDSRGVDDGVV
ncbi:hypothetical protein Tco_0916537 [Tanacetum coccineum]